MHSFERVVRERIEDVCDREFTQIFQDDPAVVIVRKAQARAAFLTRQSAPESLLAEQWGARLCSSVVRVIASSANDDTVMRFENQAAFVCNFLSDLVVGTAWDRWYHGAFSACRHLPKGEAIFTVLSANRNCLGEILHRLEKKKALDAVLRALGPEGQRRLWISIARGAPEPLPADAFRIFVQTAFQLADSLSLWQGPRASEHDFLRDYLLTNPGKPEWTDPASLAAAVTEVLRDLLRNGLLSTAGVLSRDIPERLDAVLTSSYDWLDKSYLKNSLAAMFCCVLPQKPQPSVLRPSLPTPSQLRLLRSLLSSAYGGRCQLDPNNASSYAQLLHILAALPLPEGIPSSATLQILESIVEVSSALRAGGHSDSDLMNLRRGQVDFVVAGASPSEKSRLRASLECVARAGEPAVALVEAMLGEGSSPSRATSLAEITSNCAGLFLLVRTVQDLRLSALLKESGFESLQPLLTALAIRICGDTAIEQDKLDPGAALWAGIDAEQFRSQWEHLGKLDAEGFHASLTELLAAQRLVAPGSSAEFAEQPPFIPLPLEVTTVVDFTAASLLRSWARWIPGLSGSSVGFLLEKFVHRSGDLHLYADRIEVSLSPGPLDAILKMAGYFSDSPAAFWLGNRFVRFRAAS